jgi:dienelactone hydrolase
VNRHLFAEHGRLGFGVVGLCLTGNFALAMMADETLVAPVVAEPSLPFDWSARGRSSLHLCEGDKEAVKRRVADGTTILGYRFKKDTISPPERFASLRHEFGDSFESHEVDSTRKGHHYEKLRPPSTAGKGSSS